MTVIHFEEGADKTQRKKRSARVADLKKKGKKKNVVLMRPQSGLPCFPVDSVAGEQKANLNTE